MVVQSLQRQKHRITLELTTLGDFNPHDIDLVKVALANSARTDSSQSESHDSKKGYGLLDAQEWSRQVEIEFGINQENI